MMYIKDTDIHIDVENTMFYMTTDFGRAYIQYEQPKQDVLNLTKTYVPKELRNSGLGSKLASQTLKYADKNGFHVITSCPFLEQFIKNSNSIREIPKNKL